MLPCASFPMDKLQLIFNGSPEDKWYTSPLGFKFRWIGINHVLAKAGKSATYEIREGVISPPAGTGMHLLPRLPLKSFGTPCHHSRRRNQRPLRHADRTEPWTLWKNLKLAGKDTKMLEEVQKQLISRLNFPMRCRPAIYIP